MTLRRIASGSGHRYELDGAKVPGVTTILNGALPKPALVDWAARTSADYVVDHWDELLDLPPSARRDAVVGARWAENRAATTRGKDIHTLGEALARGEDVAVPDHLIGPAEAYARWLDAWAVEALHVEAPVASRQWKYAGTLDLIARIGDTVWLLDLKTGKAIYPETALQVTAYARAEFMLDRDVELPMPHVDRVGVVHVLPDACVLLPVDASEDVWRTFLYAREVFAWIQSTKDTSPIGEALYPPDVATTRYRLEVLPPVEMEALG